jgi:hypothetical protein
LRSTKPPLYDDHIGCKVGSLPVLFWSILLLWSFVAPTACSPGVSISADNHFQGLSPTATVFTHDDQKPSTAHAGESPITPDREDLARPSPQRPQTKDITGLPEGPRSIPIETYMPEIEDYLKGREGRAGIAVVVPGTGVVYSRRGHDSFRVASVIKVVIMAAITRLAYRETRELSEQERSLLEAMITWSDNDAADVLWQEAGGAIGMDQYLDEIGIAGFQLDREGFWGDSLASPASLAQFLAKIGWDDSSVDHYTREVALELMGRVSPEQSWGITAGIQPELFSSVKVAIKNGWYPYEDGWVVNSAGVVLPSNGGQGYTIAIMTDSQPTLEYGIETIEAVASMVHQRLLGQPPP